ncbi:MAG: hypothetical protein HRU38_16120 [Saccharospirillaceae bacterium]|nr:hypothetical protein [Pseudomonadales bacterium]NRB80169.1 hypothetical protein [Saccharospirillaceae bacterium]
MQVSNSITKQKGDFLIEALVAMFLLAIISMGTALISIQSSFTIAQTKEGAIIISQLKNTLMTIDPSEICTHEYTVYIPTLKKNKTITAINCEKVEVGLTLHNNNSDNYEIIDLSDTNLELAHQSIAIGVNGYSVNGFIAF